MSVYDARLVFCEDMELSGSAEAPNVIDTGTGEDPWGAAVSPDYGAAGMVVKVVVGEVAPAGMTGITASLKHSDDNATWLPLVSFTNPDSGITKLVAGGRIASCAVPEGHKRYLRLGFEVAGTISTVGTVTAALQLGY